jgi:hypothetical protein
MAMTPQQKHQYWQAQLQAQEDSGLSKAAFCQRQGLRPSTFYYWATKLKAPETPRHHTIHPVVVSEPEQHNQAHHLTLTLPNGCQLAFPAALEPGTLQRLVAALR